MSSNKNTLSIRKYPLLPEQRIMLLNLSCMFSSRDIETINLAREIVLNEPLLNIIVGNPTCRKEAKTLYNSVQHCRYKRSCYSAEITYYSLKRVNDIYSTIAANIQETINQGFYYLYD